MGFQNKSHSGKLFLIRAVEFKLKRIYNSTVIFKTYFIKEMVRIAGNVRGCRCFSLRACFYFEGRCCLCGFLRVKLWLLTSVTHPLLRGRCDISVFTLLFHYFSHSDRSVRCASPEGKHIVGTVSTFTGLFFFSFLLYCFAQTFPSG